MSQSPYKGFNRMAVGLPEIKEDQEYQSPYKGFNRITAEMIEAGVTGVSIPL